MKKNDYITEPGQASPMNSNKYTLKKVLRILIPIFLFLIFVLIFVMYGLGLFSSPDQPAMESASVMVGSNVKEGTPGMSDEELQAALDAEREAALVSIELDAYPTFANGSSEGNLNIVNPATNSLYLEVEIRLDDTEEVIYKSGAIPPNSFIDNDKLSTVLQAGEYNATAYVTAYDPDNPDEQYNKAEFSLVVTILN